MIQLDDKRRHYKKNIFNLLIDDKDNIQVNKILLKANDHGTKTFIDVAGVFSTNFEQLFDNWD